MKEKLDIAKAELPRYLINLNNILIQPRAYFSKLINTRESQEKAITKAMVYSIICGILSQIWMIPMYGAEATVKSNYTLFYSCVMWFVFWGLSALAIKISWAFLKKEISYFKYLSIAGYQVSTLLMVFLFMNFLNLSTLRYLSPERYKQEIENNYLKSADAEPVMDFWTDPAHLIFVILGLVIIFGAILWFFHSWGVYRELNDASRKQSIIAAAIFLTLMVAVFFINQVAGEAFANS